MMVAESEITVMDQVPEGRRDGERAKNSSIFYNARDANDLDLEHDARGLIVAVLLCMACWAALGFFLLS
ncbi:hypothetical protein [Novosphingobium malaysiense]|uniref:Uncharacterized protein n=1 Tax=Novosphingobium malaysiense TaxID=1348853 RepID=A0A0B1ZJ87_9SPHN|nr:hypothetical protein [Novosphingobium malaysiense]KHK91140.1 hypothetical protein LK12_09515 [Novosphingobium malaysiense]